MAELLYDTQETHQSKKALHSVQTIVYWVDKFLFESLAWMDPTMILPSNHVVVETIKQEYSGM